MAEERRPTFFIIAGPNGAGKSTAAPFLLQDLLDIDHYINADTIAAGLSAFDPASVAFAAGRIMLTRMNELATTRSDFAIETTLATRSFAPWARRLRNEGYRCQLLFLTLPSPDLAVARVAQRVALGGHHIPTDIIHRRFHAGIRNFFDLYQSLADAWRVYDNASPQGPQLIAKQIAPADIMIADDLRWQHFQQLGTPS